MFRVLVRKGELGLEDGEYFSVSCHIGLKMGIHSPLGRKTDPYILNPKLPKLTLNPNLASIFFSTPFEAPLSLAWQARVLVWRKILRVHVPSYEVLGILVIVIIVQILVSI